jgi:glycosyltransferase involved in cell wall biosynthesis
MVLDLDATDAQLESMAPQYFGRKPRTGVRQQLSNAVESRVFHQATLFTPWSTWAAEGLRNAGVDAERIVVRPPGVDLDLWRPAMRASGERPLRLLFVGGDFERKGGDLLLEVLRAGEIPLETTLVTHGEVGDLPAGARMLRAGPNSPELRQAYEWADIFVMPTRADCFGIATIEAMATGLPVIAGNVGGASDIVEDGVTGWLIEADQRALFLALQRAVEHRDLLPGMGALGRTRAEEHFDSRRNDAAVIDLLVSLAAGQRSNGLD